MILAYAGAIPYCMKYKKDRVPVYTKEKDSLWEQMEAFYAQQEKDVVKRLGMAGINSR